MTINSNPRGGMSYHVQHPDDETRPAFFVVLRHSRECDALEALIRAGAAGCSFYDDPAPRWASSIHLLRKRGISIITVREPHGDEHPGTHARYQLISVVTRAQGACGAEPVELQRVATFSLQIRQPVQKGGVK